MMLGKSISSYLFALACLLASGIVVAEPLRIIVPEFKGQESVGRYVMTTLFFELSKAFASEGTREKGAWILYGREALTEQSHQAAIEFASWPSVRADMVLWGSTLSYGNDLVVPMSLTITPLTESRQVRPELWSVLGKTSHGESIELSLGLPRRYYDLEPIVLPRKLVDAYTQPKGVPLYKSKSGGQIIGYAGGVFTFLSFTPEAVKLHSQEGIEGWARLPQLPDSNNHSITFAKGLVSYLRGDWHGAIAQFENVLQNRNTPAALRMDTKLLIGVATEQLGRNGMDYFKSAYHDNRLDRVSAKYVMMGYLSEMIKAQGRHDKQSERKSREQLTSFLRNTAVLYPTEDPWIEKLRKLIAVS